MKHVRVLLLSVFAAAMTAAAQKPYTAAKIVFNHPGPYTQAQLESAVGMHPGMKFNAADMGAAAQALVDTGFFSSAGAALASGPYAAITLVFDIEPIDRAQMMHVGFENFVWLSHAEIKAVLQVKAPLFLDYLPENSPLADVFDKALTDALAGKGVTATVANDTIEPSLFYPERTLEFRIAAPRIRVANVKLSGVEEEFASLIQRSVNAAAKAPYTDRTEDLILAPLRDAGYIQASLSGVTLDPTIAGDSASVVLSATLNPGDIYRVSRLTFAGTPLLSADSFVASEKLHAGDVASRALLLQTLAPLDAAYRRQGYMDVLVEAAPAIDAVTHQVAYTVEVTPGEQYRLRQVTATNLDPAARADFNRGFLMKSGDLYNPEYVTSFLENNTVLRALDGYSFAYTADADPNTHTVDLVLTFFRGAGPVSPR
jgi:outer membrane protein insertion porin family